jgi:hypothetical protein
MAHPNARAPRADGETQERRRRRDGTLDRMTELKLAIPDAIREANPGRQFYWSNDTGQKIYNRTVLDDWDKVEGIDPITVDADKDGTPIKAHLLSKPNEFVQEDNARKEAALKDQEDGIFRRGDIVGEGASDLSGDVAYTPKEGNRINRL